MREPVDSPCGQLTDSRDSGWFATPESDPLNQPLPAQTAPVTQPESGRESKTLIHTPSDLLIHGAPPSVVCVRTRHAHTPRTHTGRRDAKKPTR